MAVFHGRLNAHQGCSRSWDRIFPDGERGANSIPTKRGKICMHCGMDCRAINMPPETPSDAPMSKLSWKASEAHRSDAGASSDTVVVKYSQHQNPGTCQNAVIQAQVKSAQIAAWSEAACAGDVISGKWGNSVPCTPPQTPRLKIPPPVTRAKSAGENSR